MHRLGGKVAVVLGASAEEGTGWAIAEGLAGAGAKVVVGARSEAPLKNLASKIGGTAVVCDACKGDQIQTLINVAVRTYGRLDVAINSAGSSTPSTIADITDETLASMLQLNFVGHVNFVKYAAAAMTDGGSIIIISSLAATHNSPPHFAYAAAKSATDCMVRYAAAEYGPRNIRVNSILPGPIMSDMAKTMLSDPSISGAFLKEIPLGRVGYPAEFADACLWLAGPAYITGANIPICGGMQLNRFPFVSEIPGGESAWEDNCKTLYDRSEGKRQGR